MENDRIQELIDAYFDEALDDRGLRELEELMRSEPGVVRRFVRSARFEALLRRHFDRRAAESVAEAAIRRAIAAPPVESAATRVRRWRWRTAVSDHAWGPIGAIVAHAVLLYVLVRWVVLPMVSPHPPVEVRLTRNETVELDPIEPLQEAARVPEWPAIPPPLDGPPMAITPPESAAEVVRSPERVPRIVYGHAGGMNEPAWLQGRALPARRVLLGRYAPEWADRTEPAIDRALGWLQDARQPGGGWASAGSDRADVAMTALGILAFLARGEPLTTLQSDLQMLTEAAASREGPFHGVSSSARSLAACALIESWARIPLPPLRRAAELAIDRLVAEQRAPNWWERTDSWTLTWHVLAIRLALATGLDVPDGPAVHAELVQRLKTLGDPRSGLYQGGRPAIHDVERLAASALALQWLREESSPEARHLVAGLQSVPLRDASGVFARHLLTQVRFNAGGAVWERGRSEIADVWLTTQRPDGSWGSDGSPADSNAVRDTALAVLSLSVCYRYPPAGEWPLWRAAAAHRTGMCIIPGLALAGPWAAVR